MPDLGRCVAPASRLHRLRSAATKRLLWQKVHGPNSLPFPDYDDDPLDCEVPTPVPGISHKDAGVDLAMKVDPGLAEKYLFDDGSDEADDRALFDAMSVEFPMSRYLSYFECVRGLVPDRFD